MFVIALVANGEYSQYHGNTKADVLAEFVTLLNRVNGVYKREMGYFYQLHPQTDDLICLHPCSALSNDDAVLDEVNGYIGTKGVTLSSFDVGHVVTTGSGGLACLGVVCNPSYKTCGTTGLPTPTTDFFFVSCEWEIGVPLLFFQDC